MGKSYLVLVTLLISLVLLPSCGPATDTKAYAQTRFVMGTVCTVTLYQRVRGFDIEEAFTLLRDIEKKMSVTLPESEVHAVNTSAGIGPVDVSEDTLFVIEESLAYGAESAGKFDITILPVVSLWGIGTTDQRIPSAEEIEAALPLVDLDAVRVDRDAGTVFLTARGMGIDLGGIAKGYAADALKDFLQSSGFTRGIVNLGGNITTFGEKADGSPWRIGIQDPYDTRGSYIALVDVAEGAVVTSGIYERYFEQNGVVYHHILDTETGYPVINELAGITILSPDGVAADAYSTVVFSLGLSTGFELVESIPSLEGVFVTKDRKIHISSGLSGLFSLTDPDYELMDD